MSVMNSFNTSKGLFSQALTRWSAQEDIQFDNGRPNLDPNMYLPLEGPNVDPYLSISSEITWEVSGLFLVNLTDRGKMDWVKTSRNTVLVRDTKLGGESIIQLQDIGSPNWARFDAADGAGVEHSWSDGAETLSVAADNNVEFQSTLNAGQRFIIEPFGRPVKIELICSCNNSNIGVQVYFSDNSVKQQDFLLSTATVTYWRVTIIAKPISPKARIMVDLVLVLNNDCAWQSLAVSPAEIIQEVVKHPAPAGPSYRDRRF